MSSVGRLARPDCAWPEHVSMTYRHDWEKINYDFAWFERMMNRKRKELFALHGHDAGRTRLLQLLKEIHADLRSFIVDHIQYFNAVCSSSEDQTVFRRVKDQARIEYEDELCQRKQQIEKEDKAFPCCLFS